jgi:hypothetical protein
MGCCSRPVLIYVGLDLVETSPTTIAIACHLADIHFLATSPPIYPDLHTRRYVTSVQLGRVCEMSHIKLYNVHYTITRSLQS